MLEIEFFQCAGGTCPRRYALYAVIYASVYRMYPDLPTNWRYLCYYHVDYLAHSDTSFNITFQPWGQI